MSRVEYIVCDLCSKPITCGLSFTGFYSRIDKGREPEKLEYNPRDYCLNCSQIVVVKMANNQAIFEMNEENK